jgi:hypothetical protein
VKVKQVKKESGFRKVGVDLYILDCILVVKVDQVEEVSKFVKVKANL